MRILDTVLDGVRLIQPVVYEDFRGTNFESYNEVMYRDELPFSPFVVDSISTSRKHTLRGIHGDSKTTKLVSCLYGTIHMVIINRDPDSKKTACNSLAMAPPQIKPRASIAIILSI